MLGMELDPTLSPQLRSPACINTACHLENHKLLVMCSVTLALTISKSFWGKVTSATQTAQIDGGHRARKRTKTFSLAWPPILQNPTDLTPNEDMVSQRQVGPRGAELATGLPGDKHTQTDPNPHGWSSHPSYMLRCHQLTTLTQSGRNKHRHA